MSRENENRLAALREEARHLGWATEGATDDEAEAIIETRLRETLTGRGVRPDLIEALMCAPYSRISSVLKRANVLSRMLNDDREQSVAAAATRVRRILQGATEPVAPTPDRAALTVTEERTLLAFLGTVAPQLEQSFRAGDYTDALDTLAALSEPIHRLLNKYPALPDDLTARSARLSLLAQADRLYLRLADFSRLTL